MISRQTRQKWNCLRAIFPLCVVLHAVLKNADCAQIKSEAPEKDYNNFKVFRLQVQSNETLDALKALYSEGALDFWKEPTTGETDVMVSPEQLPKLKSLIDKDKIEHQVMFENLKSAIMAERKSSMNRQGNKMNWESYQRLDTIYDWMESLVSDHRDGESETVVSVTTEIIGKSYEDRPLKVLKIQKNWNQINGFNRSAIWIDAGIHAREWIAPATATYLAKSIIEASVKNELWASMFDWYILPVINVDGYEYSHTTDRFWRKTRSYPREGSSIIDYLVNICVGTDPNRNWDYKWGGMGGSINPCAPNYRGKESSSEVEVRAVQDYILSKKDHLKMYLTLHSYSQLVLLPWGHSYVYAEDYDELLRVGKKAAKRLEAVHGTRYNVGATPYVLYPASGGSHDWAKGVAGIKYSYTLELPDRGFYGFLLPASRIIQTGEETLEFLKSATEDMTQLYYYNLSN